MDEAKKFNRDTGKEIFLNGSSKENVSQSHRQRSGRGGSSCLKAAAVLYKGQTPRMESFSDFII